MITGYVSPSQEAYVELIVVTPSGRQENIEVVVDTGYDGALLLPSELIHRFDLPWQRRGRAFLADGSEVIFEIYEAEVIFAGNEQLISVDEAETKPLIGMALLQGYSLYMEVVDGGIVRVELLP